jgi:Na+-transporting methylmalonyl-CoA/oxaloacetate decarboxylase gamma subunit
MNNLVLQSLAIYGLAIVISLLVALLIKGIVMSIALTQKKTPAVPSLSAKTAEPTDNAEDDIAVVAAAVYAMFGSYRIVHIESRERGRVWTAEGRVSHHVSHAPHRSSRRQQP